MGSTELEKYDQEHKQHVEIATHSRELANGIKDEQSFNLAAEFMLDIKDHRKKWATKMGPLLEAAQDAKRAAERSRKKTCDLIDEVDLPLKRAECEIMKPAMAKFEQEEENRRLKKQAEIEKEHRERQEEAKLEMAIKYEGEGEKDVAEQIISQPTVKVAVVMPKKTQVAGVSFSWDYSAEVVNPKALLEAVLKNVCPMTCTPPNMTYLNARARSDKDAFSIPGVKLIKTRSVTGNTSRRF